MVTDKSRLIATTVAGAGLLLWFAGFNFVGFDILEAGWDLLAAPVASIALIATIRFATDAAAVPRQLRTLRTVSYVLSVMAFLIWTAAAILMYIAYSGCVGAC